MIKKAARIAAWRDCWLFQLEAASVSAVGLGSDANSVVEYWTGEEVTEDLSAVGVTVTDGLTVSGVDTGLVAIGDSVDDADTKSVVGAT